MSETTIVHCLIVVPLRPGSCFCETAHLGGNNGELFAEPEVDFLSRDYFIFRCFPITPPYTSTLSSVAFPLASLAAPGNTGAVLMWVHLELFVFTCVHTKPPAIHQLWLNASTPKLIPKDSLALWFLLQ